MEVSGRRVRDRLLFWVPVAFFAAVVSYQLLGPVPIGMSDNGDFSRVAAPLGLWPTAAPPGSPDSRTQFHFFLPAYTIHQESWDSGVPSTEIWIAWAAKGISRVLLPKDHFDLRVMGVLHALIMLMALICLLRSLRERNPWIRLSAAALVLWMWTDVMYVQQFSTAYTDAGAVVALCLIFSVTLIVLLAPGGRRVWWAPVYALAGLFLLGTKLQHAPALVPLAAFCILMAFRRGVSRPARMVWSVTPFLLAGTAFFMARETPEQYRTAPAFSVVFFKIAVLARDPGRALADFRMPQEEYGKYIGHYYYEHTIPYDKPGFNEKIRSLVTPGSLASFYAHNPRTLWRVVRADWLVSASDVNLGNYGILRETDVRDRKASPEFNLWSGFRRRLFMGAPPYPLVFFAAAFLLGAGGVFSRKWRAGFPLWPVPAMMTLVALSGFLTSSLMDAAETARHMVLFQAGTDLTILSLFLALVVRNAPTRA